MKTLPARRLSFILAVFLLPAAPVYAQGRALPYIIEEGVLPGVTWADDIHPIFTRNVCRNCHLRGNVLYVDELGEFALGLVDPLDYANPYYSYHELVYAEGAPQAMEDEPLRDGQCCWPYGYPAHKQRRIWVGRSERSALVHKVERDYYDWDMPPRFLEEGLRFRWGLPMPWVKPEAAEGGLNEPLKVRGFLTQAFLYVKAWLGLMEPTRLKPAIPAHDRALIRHWIDHAVQLRTGGTAIEALALDRRADPVEGAKVTFVGNFNNQDRREVTDTVHIETGADGAASISFPELSVITSFWFIKAEKDGRESGYVPVTIVPGETQRVRLGIPH